MRLDGVNARICRQVAARGRPGGLHLRQFARPEQAQLAGQPELLHIRRARVYRGQQPAQVFRRGRAQQEFLALRRRGAQLNHQRNALARHDRQHIGGGDQPDSHGQPELRYWQQAPHWLQLHDGALYKRVGGRLLGHGCRLSVVRHLRGVHAPTAGQRQHAACKPVVDQMADRHQHRPRRRRGLQHN